MLAATLAAATPRAASRPAVPAFRHIVVIVLENKEASQIDERSAPELSTLGRRYALLTGYYAVAHPSLPNYLALVSGSTQGITSDCTDCLVDAPNLADSLEAAGKTWRTYAEGLPRTGFTGASAGRYAKKHDPLLYFRDVVSRPDRLARINPLSRFPRDLRRGRLPDFALVVPDLCHDMHDCSVAAGDSWLGAFVRPLLTGALAAGSAVFVVFDEGVTSARGGGHVAAFVLGGLVRPHATATVTLDHYSLLRTVEDAWHLPLLGRSSTARPITGIWR